MKIGIMQPYFFPYIGYWQLMNAVDQYVVYDDVNFIKGGWINRNRILIGNEAKYYNVQMVGAGSYKKINEIYVEHKKEVLEKKLRTLKNAYCKAPYFNKIFPIIQDIILNENENLAKYLMNSIKIIHDYLNMKSILLFSSEIKKDNEKSGAQKVIEICNILNADTYYNAVGGQDLYSFSEFKENGLYLKFLKTKEVEYKQFNDKFIPNLSIIDVMMFNSKEKVKEYLYLYDLIEDNGEK